MRTIRYSCATEGYEDSWVELDARWTRDDEADLVGLKSNAEYFTLFWRKVRAMHLVDGERVYSDAAALTDDTRDIDLVLWGFVLGVLFFAYKEAKALTPFSARVSPPTSGATSLTTPPAPPIQSPTP